MHYFRNLVALDVSFKQQAVYLYIEGTEKHTNTIVMDITKTKN